MTSLLSAFDPCSNSFFNNWFILLIFILLPLWTCYWYSFSTIHCAFLKVVKYLASLFLHKKAKNELLFVSLFIFLLMVNFLGLVPYGFSMSSHFSFNFSLALSLWLMAVIWGFKKNFTSNIAHLTPMGCPIILIPFMVLVETISALIRPMTLALRLMSNMLAGHMIISLVSMSYYQLPFYLSPFLMLMNIGFFFFELSVAVIQTYVYSMLMNLYWKETE
uniref:ATP synthase subunit a n=1 Tax=Osborniella crotophagae TaxID=1912107 RepID=A0A7T1M8D8_9NEOP|nr:ATP synthase F0 subunit 6 [Osborniella crotophagae]